MARSKTRFLYLCFEGLPKTVFDSQVVGFLKAMALHGLVFDLLIFEDLLSAFRNRSWTAKRLEELKSTWGGEISYVPLGTKVEFPLAVCVFLLLLAPDLIRGRWLVFHCRGYYSALLAALLKRLSRRVFFVYDVRGDTEGEFLYRTPEGGSGRWLRRQVELRLLRGAEGLALRAADQILCISSALKERLRERWGLEGKVIEVIPTCADPRLFGFDVQTRESTRRSLGLDSRVVVVYSGSMYRWQLMDTVVEIARSLSEDLPHLHLLCLTPHLAEAASRLANGLPPDSYTLLHVRHAEMAGYLMAADLGILIREDHPLNQVACPTKFAEYIMCGLPVLMTERVGDLSVLVAKEKLGIVIKDPKDLTAFRKAILALLQEASSAEWRARAARIGRECFAWDRYSPLLREIYGKAALSYDATT